MSPICCVLSCRSRATAAEATATEKIKAAEAACQERVFALEAEVRAVAKRAEELEAVARRATELEAVAASANAARDAERCVGVQRRNITGRIRKMSCFTACLCRAGGRQGSELTNCRPRLRAPALHARPRGACKSSRVTSRATGPKQCQMFFVAQACSNKAGR